jgi:hypothetical protein
MVSMQAMVIIQVLAFIGLLPISMIEVRSNFGGLLAAIIFLKIWDQEILLFRGLLRDSSNFDDEA